MVLSIALYHKQFNIKHQLFVYPLLNDQTVLFQTIHFRVICSQFKYQTVLFDP